MHAYNYEITIFLFKYCLFFKEFRFLPNFKRLKLIGFIFLKNPSYAIKKNTNKKPDSE